MRWETLRKEGSVVCQKAQKEHTFEKALETIRIRLLYLQEFGLLGG
jgi:hypothetical protein